MRHPERHPKELELDGRFHVVRRLGSGAMGEVYAAWDTRRGEKVAVKLLRARDASALYRFKKEFRSLAGVVHPNLISLYELIASENRLFFTMEIVEGQTFVEHVRPAAGDAGGKERGEVWVDEPGTGGELDLGRLGPALRQLVLGVQALHDAGKLHRDLKPPNVMVTAAGRLVVLDFGMVTELAPDLQSLGTGLTGTVAYMAPEQATAAPVTAASDWYAVGVILYQALTGRLPFSGSVFEVLMHKQEQTAPSPAELTDGLPRDLVDLCVALLATDPDRRPSGAEVLARLGEAGEVMDGMGGGDRAGHPAGRDQERAALEEAFSASREGRAVAVYVHGPPGAGKTALIESFLASRRCRVLRGRCHERERVPHQALDGVVDSLSSYLTSLADREVAELLPADVDALTHVFPVLRRIYVLSLQPPPRPDRPDLGNLEPRAFEQLAELLGRIARRRPLVLFVDDLHFADAESAAELQDLLRPLAAVPLLLIASFDSEAIDRKPFLSDLLAGAGNEARCRVAVAPLGEDP